MNALEAMAQPEGSARSFLGAINQAKFVEHEVVETPKEEKFTADDFMNICEIANSNLNQDKKQIKEGKKTFLSPEVTPVVNEVDLKELNLSDEYVDSIIEKSFGVKEEKKVNKKVELKEDKLQEWIKKFSLCIQEGQKLLAEMTTCGGIGVSFANPQQKRKKKKKQLRKILGVK